MAGVFDIDQIWEVGEQLSGCQHSLVDHHLGRETADIECFRLNHRRVVADDVTGLLTDQVELALKGVAYRPMPAASQLLRNLGIYGVGGVIAPFVGIKLIDLAVAGLGLA